MQPYSAVAPSYIRLVGNLQYDQHESVDDINMKDLDRLKDLCAVLLLSLGTDKARFSSYWHCCQQENCYPK